MCGKRYALDHSQSIRIDQKVREVTIAVINGNERPKKLVTQALEGEDYTTNCYPGFRRRYKKRLVTVVRKRLRRKRIVLPKSCEEIDFENVALKEHLYLPNKECILKYDSSADPKEKMIKGKERIVIFSTEYCLSSLKQSDQWFMDGMYSVVMTNLRKKFEHGSYHLGTIKTCPIQWGSKGQIYTVHGNFRNPASPLVHILLTRKNKTTYERAFKKVRELVIDFEPGTPWMQPTRLTTDFEKGK